MNAREPDLDVENVRTPPHSTEAEQSILGGLLIDNRGWTVASSMLAEGDFYKSEHKAVYAAIAALASRNKAADVVTVYDQLQRDGKADEAGGLAYLNAMAQSVPSAANMRRYCEIVRDRAMLRELIVAAGKAADLAWESKDANEAMDKAGALFSQLSRRQVRKEPELLRDLLVRAIDRYTKLSQGEGTTAISTGIAPLDKLLNGGLRPGKVYGIAARPSVGKSSASRSIGIHAALNGYTTLLLSQEMPNDEVTDCIVAELARINSQKLQTGELDSEDWSRLVEAVDDAKDAHFRVDDEGGLTINAIRNKARAVKGLKVLMLDYLQLSVSTLKGASTNDQVAEISKGLKALSMEMGIPIVVLSQLNRDVEKRQDKEPQLADLRDSGAIEQDLDIAVFLWTAREFDQGARRIVGWKVAKHRGGPKGTFAMEFDAPRYRWTESTAELRPAASTSRGDL